MAIPPDQPPSVNGEAQFEELWNRFGIVRDRVGAKPPPEPRNLEERKADPRTPLFQELVDHVREGSGLAEYFNSADASADPD
jgi:hypothetical protein